MTNNSVTLPGTTLGMLGGGQFRVLFSEAALKMG